MGAIIQNCAEICRIELLLHYARTTGRNIIMKTMYIKLKSINEVKQFVNDVSKMEGDFDLISGRYIIDAKSIMGIFSLDLTQPLKLCTDVKDEGYIQILEKYQVDIIDEN